LRSGITDCERSWAAMLNRQANEVNEGSAYDANPASAI